jgi:hypothetical protein
MGLDARSAATAVILGLVGVASVVGPAWLSRPAPPRPSVPIGGRPGPPAPPPTARGALERANTLRLTAEQRTRLAALDHTWGETAGALDRAVAAAGAEFERFTHQASPWRASGAEIQKESAGYRELGAAHRAARERHAEAARAVLTEGPAPEPGARTGHEGAGGRR